MTYYTNVKGIFKFKSQIYKSKETLECTTECYIVHKRCCYMYIVWPTEGVLMSGKFKIEESQPLPSVPGYDLDINENVQTSPRADRYKHV